AVVFDLDELLAGRHHIRAGQGQFGEQSGAYDEVLRGADEVVIERVIGRTDLESHLRAPGVSRALGPDVPGMLAAPPRYPGNRRRIIAGQPRFAALSWLTWGRTRTTDRGPPAPFDARVSGLGEALGDEGEGELLEPTPGGVGDVAERSLPGEHGQA